MVRARPPVPLDISIQSDAKLLEALITLLSLKDEHLLDELRTIFQVAARGGSELGDAEVAVWDEISYRLDCIKLLVDQEEPAGERDSQH